MPVYNVANTIAQTTAPGVAQTALQVTVPATRRLRVTGFSVSGHSVGPTNGRGWVRVVRQTTAGTSGGSVTPVAVDAAETAALHSAAETFTVEPTSTTVVAGPYPLSPVSTLLAYQFAPGEEVVVPASGRLGVQVFFPTTAQTVRATLTVAE